MVKPPKEEPTENEIAKLADAGLKALLKMPPKPHDQITGKPKKKPIGKKQDRGNK